MTIPAAKKSSSPFVSEFAEQLMSYVHNNPYVQGKINQSLNTGAGDLSRFFDKLEFAEETNIAVYEELYKTLNKGSNIDDDENNEALNKYLDGIACKTTKFLFNDTMTDLNDEVIKNLGDDYNKLIKACNDNKTTMVDILLTATIVVYAQVATMGYYNKAEINNKINPGEFDDVDPTDVEGLNISELPEFHPVKFNQQVSIPINTFNETLSKQYLENKTAILIDNLNKLNNNLEAISPLLEQEMKRGSQNHQSRIQEVQQTIANGMQSIKESLNISDISHMHDTINQTMKNIESSVKENIVNTSLKDKILSILSRAITFGLYEYKSEKTQQREEVANQVVDSFKNQLQSWKNEQAPGIAVKEEKEATNTMSMQITSG